MMFRLLQKLLLRIVRYKTLPEDTSHLTLNTELPVFYALHVRQLSALLVLDDAVRSLGLPTPRTAFTAPAIGEAPAVSERSRFFFLTRRGQPSPLQRNPYRYSGRLTRLVQRACADPTLNARIVPVSIFWGRAPNNQDSIVKALFADNWVTPGFFSQAFRLLLHGRQTVIKFGPPMDLQTELGGRDPAVALRRIARLLRAEFRQERELVIGPNLSHRQILANEVIASEGVRMAIAREAAERHTGTDTVELRARRLTFEIASDYSYPFVRAYDIGLARLWNRIYDGIDVHGFEQIPQAGAGAEIVYLPCHRSHIDYLLLSYVIYHRGLQIPHIAAGDNLNMPVVGSLLRRGGAFFLRRSFKGDALYSEVFSAYLHTIIQRGFPIEYFVEGGRSRTGRTLPPKVGLLGMTVESWLRDPARPMVFVPVYIGYERLVEGDTYAAELAGQPKKRESVMGLLRSIRTLREQFGKVHVNFGEPIRIEDHPVAAGEDSRAMIGRLGSLVVTRINDAVVINPINLVALAFTGAARGAMDGGLLQRMLETYRTLLREAPYSERQVMTPMSGREILEYAKQQGVVREIPHPMGHILQADARQTLLLSYFRNNVLHTLVLPSLVATLVALNEVIDQQRLVSIVQRMYPFLRKELFLWRSDEQVAQGVTAAVDVMVAHGLVHRDDQQITLAGPQQVETLIMTQLARLVQQPLERYYLVVALLERFGSGHLSQRSLEDTAWLLAQRIAYLHESRTPEYFDRTSFRAIITSLIEMRAVEDRDGFLHSSDDLRALAREAYGLLPVEARLALEQVERMSESDLRGAEKILV